MLEGGSMTVAGSAVTYGGAIGSQQYVTVGQQCQPGMYYQEVR